VTNSTPHGFSIIGRDSHTPGRAKVLMIEHRAARSWRCPASDSDGARVRCSSGPHMMETASTCSVLPERCSSGPGCPQKCLHCRGAHGELYAPENRSKFQRIRTLPDFRRRPLPHEKYYISHNLRLQRTIPCVGGASREMRSWPQSASAESIEICGLWRHSPSTARPLPSRARSDPEQSASEWQARVW